jgi:tetratricopeptide (TPR) repeat protein
MRTKQWQSQWHSAAQGLRPFVDMEIDEYYHEIAMRWPGPGQSPGKQIVDLCLAAVAEYPESSTFWYDLGIIMQRCGDDHGYSGEDYLRCFENAVRCHPGNAEASRELGYVLDIYFDAYDRAEHAFRKAIELGADQECYFGLARVLAQMGKVDDAIASLSKDVCPFHDHPDIQHLRDEILAGGWYWADVEKDKGIADL